MTSTKDTAAARSFPRSQKGRASPGSTPARPARPGKDERVHRSVRSCPLSSGTAAFRLQRRRYRAVSRSHVQRATHWERRVTARSGAVSPLSAARSRLPPARPRTRRAARRARKPLRGRSSSRGACATTACRASPTQVEEAAVSISRARGSTPGPPHSDPHAGHAQGSLREAPPVAFGQRRASSSPR
jgi:hypothetical protein